MIAIYAFNGGTTAEVAAGEPDDELVQPGHPRPAARDAFFTSIKVGLAATGIALVLGTLASFAVARHRFFGRETVSFLVVIPIALPGSSQAWP